MFSGTNIQEIDLSNFDASEDLKIKLEEALPKVLKWYVDTYQKLENR